MAVTGYSVRYGNVIFSDIQTLDFREDVYRDDSGTDVMYHRARHRFTTFTWQNVGHFMGAMTTGGLGRTGTTAAITNTVLLETMRDRNRYEWSLGGVPLLRVEPSPDGTTPPSALMDTDNGPKIVDVRFTQPTGSAIRVEMTIELHYIRCSSDDSIIQNTHGAARDATNMVASNRWSSTDQMDESQFWLTSVEGTLRVKHREAFPHCYRHLCTPGLRPNYKRMAQAFIQSEDGLSLRYRIVDQQRHAAPPWPAIDWQCKHSETVPKFGYFTMSQFAITLRGAPDAKKSDLFSAAAKAAEARLGFLQRVATAPALPSGTTPAEDPLGEGTQVLPVMAEFHDDLDQNQISLIVGIKRVATQGTEEIEDVGPIQKYLNMQISRMNAVFYTLDGYDRSTWPRPGNYDSATPAGIFSTYLQHPCDNTKGITDITYCGTVPELKPEREGDPQGDVTDGSDGYGATIPDDQPSQTQQVNAWFTHVRSEGYYELIESGWGVSPFANATLAVSGDPTVAVIQVHSGVWYCTFTWNHERLGAWPQVLNPNEKFTDENGINYYPLDCDFSPAYPLESGTKKDRVYGIEGTYRFAIDRGPKVGDKLRTGRVPIDDKVAWSFFEANADNWQDGETFLKMDNQGGANS